jgi:membrane protein implicated in regulation of membrane protease activity
MSIKRLNIPFFCGGIIVAAILCLFIPWYICMGAFALIIVATYIIEWRIPSFRAKPKKR